LPRQLNKKGSILILALWTLTLLTVFSVHIGLTVRQRATLLSRVENRTQARWLAEAGVKKAIAALRHDIQRNKGVYTPYGKLYRHNNRAMFADIDMGVGKSAVMYIFHDGLKPDPEIRYGFVDEESKININTVQQDVLVRLMQIVVTSDEEKAKTLAEAIIDWREIGESQLTGFYSDDFYINLQDSYESKDAHFEILDELLLVRGFNQDILDQLKPFITVFGDGLININTANRHVLQALGISDVLVEKILLTRRGVDVEESTADDFIYQRAYDLASDILRFSDLDKNEIQQIDALNALGLIKTNSVYYSISGKAQLNNSQDALEVVCVYNAQESWVEYWREK